MDRYDKQFQQLGGTKLGDVFIILIGVSSIYGCMIGVESLIKWAMK